MVGAELWPTATKERRKVSRILSRFNDFYGLVGRFKLDCFIKPPAAEQGMAPEFARTMQSLNSGPQERLSNHAPITVDLPLSVKRRPLLDSHNVAKDFQPVKPFRLLSL